MPQLSLLRPDGQEALPSADSATLASADVQADAHTGATAGPATAGLARAACKRGRFCCCGRCFDGAPCCCLRHSWRVSRCSSAAAERGQGECRRPALQVDFPSIAMAQRSSRAQWQRLDMGSQCLWAVASALVHFGFGPAEHSGLAVGLLSAMVGRYAACAC